MKTSKLFTIGTVDAIKGLVVTILTLIVTMLITSINAGEFPVKFEEWKPILLASLGGGLAYILKNFLTNSNNQILKSEKNETERP